MKLPAAAAQLQSLEPSLCTPQVVPGQLATAVHTVLLSILAGQVPLPEPPAPPPPVAEPPAPPPPVAEPPAMPPAPAPPAAAPALPPVPPLAPPVLPPVPAVAVVPAVPLPPAEVPAVGVEPVPAVGVEPVPAVGVEPVPAVPVLGGSSLLQPEPTRVTKEVSRANAAKDVRFMSVS
ncbi:MAG: hypothetical protein EOO73_18290 [Myxococcales bacterium]|nr:MAG: hypothetical protein EOO73_18290 [Myxococcales bacterium]